MFLDKNDQGLYNKLLKILKRGTQSSEFHQTAAIVLEDKTINQSCGEEKRIDPEIFQGKKTLLQLSLCSSALIPLKEYVHLPLTSRQNLLCISCMITNSEC